MIAVILHPQWLDVLFKMGLVVKTHSNLNAHPLMFHRLRLHCPNAIKVLFRRVRSVIIDPFGRGVRVEISGTWVRAPGYFYGGGRASYELPAVERFNRWLAKHPSGLVVDVGCSISTYGLIALSASPDTHVVAVDPDFASLVWTRCICGKVKNPSRLILVHGFVVANAGPSTDARSAAQEIKSELDRRSARRFSEVTKYRDSNDSGETTVPRHSIDNLLVGLDCKGGLLIKIDVEGNELEVLEGARLVISSKRPSLLVSVHPMFGVDVGKVRMFFEPLGYTAEHFATDHEEHWWCEPDTARVS